MRANARRRNATAAPEVEVTRRNGQLQLDYDFSKRTEQGPWSLVVTVNSVDDHLPPRTFTFKVEGPLQGMIETRLALSDKQHYDIYMSTTDARGKPSESKLTMLRPVGVKQQLGAVPVMPLVGRVVALLRRAFPPRRGTS